MQFKIFSIVSLLALTSSVAMALPTPAPEPQACRIYGNCIKRDVAPMLEARCRLLRWCIKRDPASEAYRPLFWKKGEALPPVATANDKRAVDQVVKGRELTA
ncbi:hypothetical protein QBC35DRAFT_446804 [Podospora australis]|uniref:Uncharacterized protein n=1 Tax=Podospora australis TaxID=1536484 RepID=A0AAN6X2T9_9PEZI|nr:hypothetical protein QBC35DRAFT_446804 [Podospora australis]